jgi:hypothetical protein
VNRISFLLLLTLAAANSGLAEETSFRHIHAPNKKNNLVKAVLTLSDNDKAVEVLPTKSDPVTIPYAQIDKFSYEFTRKHRINEETVFTAPVGGAILMFTKSRSHWLEIDYHNQDLPKKYVLRMDKKNYIRILDAIKAHTGKDAEILGNVDKR